MLERRRGANTQKLGWLLTSRLLLALFSIAVIAITAGQHLKESSYYPAYTLLVIVCFADLIYLIVYRLRGGSMSFVTFQLGFDVIFVTLLILLSGASRSSFSVLYYAVVLGGATLISKRSALFFASLATVLLSGVTISYYLVHQYGGTLPLVSPNWIEMAKQNLNTVLGYLVAQGVALHLVAFLAGQLAARAADVRVLYGRILDNMSQGILVADQSNRVLYANREAARLLGFAFSPQPPHSVLEDILPAAQASKVKQMLDARREGITEMQFETTDAEAGARNVEVKTSILRDAHNRRVGTIILLTDLTLRHRLEESQKRVERLQEIEEMSAGLAHEIRNPLASIRGCTQELGKLAFDDQTNSKLAAIVCRESDRLDKIVNDFLDLAKLRPPVFSRTELDNLVEEVVILLRSREDARDIQIINEVKDKMHVYCDPEQLRQVLLNLGINSLEALNGHGYIRLTARRTIVGESSVTTRNLLDPGFEGYLIQVVDNGPGIKDEILPKLFTPFFTTKQHGTGMGLAIANKIVAEHKGLLEIHNGSSKGAAARIWLPLYPRSALRRSDISWMQK
jgi:two-component system sensor histidine kinase PilS (NtrC family)